MGKRIDGDTPNMIEEYRKELMAFYKPHFENEKSLTEFVNLAFNYDKKYDQIRFMIHQVQRFVSLANDIDKIRPARDSFRIFFLKICLESLCETSGKNKTTFFNEFEKYFSDEGTTYIISNIVFTGIDEPKNPSISQLIVLSNIENQKITMSSFLNIVKIVRDKVAHEGDYWSTQIFAHDNDSIRVTSLITTKENIFNLDKNTWNDVLSILNQKDITYIFETSLDYSKFIFYFVQACIGFIKNYQDKLCE